MGELSHNPSQIPCKVGGLCDHNLGKSSIKKVEISMRWPLITLAVLSACSNEASHLGNPLLLPINAIATVGQNAAYNQRRAQVEVFVKSNFDALIRDIMAGGGPVLTEAMDIAGIRAGDRPARVIQLQSDIALYNTAPGALVTALMVFSS
jgi:hypothetical protein